MKEGDGERLVGGEGKGSKEIDDELGDLVLKGPLGGMGGSPEFN